MTTQLDDPRPDAHPRGVAAGATPPGRSFHLLPQWQEDRPEWNTPVTIPHGVSSVRIAREGQARLVPVASGDGTVLVEPVTVGDAPRLLLATLGTDPVRLNDQWAPPAVLLREGDQFRVGDGPVLEVAIFCRPFVGTAPPELAGQPCPLCRVEFTAKSRLYRCPFCGCGLHLEEDGGENALQCALVGAACPSCRKPVRLETGYLTKPQFLEDRS